MAWLVGRDIGYSASPSMHRAAFAELGLDHRYELADVTAERLPVAVARLREAGALGANVTIPFKSSVISLLDGIDSVAKRAGAVNTILARDGRLSGSNTDVPALAEAMGTLGRPSRAVVLGSGGAARAVAVALQSLGVLDVTLVSRSGGGPVAPWDDLPALLPEADLLLNATPVGAGGDDTPVPGRLLHGGLAVLDLVYRPSPTRLVREARAAGARACGGAGVLLGQGWRSLEAWLGAPLPAAAREAMASALRRELGEGADV